MVKKIILIFAAMLISVTISFAQQDSLPGKYMKKVLIKAKWGDKPGEFKLEPINETHEWKTFIVFDKGGNIYCRP